ncbi:hypothetical protein P3T17_004514 [Paraburkholderia sp. GAS82]
MRRFALVFLSCMTLAITCAAQKPPRCDSDVEIARSDGACKSTAAGQGSKAGALSASRSGMSPGEAASATGAFATIRSLNKGATVPHYPATNVPTSDESSPSDAPSDVSPTKKPPSSVKKPSARRPDPMEPIPDNNRLRPVTPPRKPIWPIVVRILAALLSLAVLAHVIRKWLRRPMSTRCYVRMRSDPGNQSCRLPSHHMVYPSVEVRLGSTSWEAHIGTMSGRVIS